MGKYLKAQDTALRLIKKAGVLVTIDRKSSENFDPITQTELSDIASKEFYAVKLAPSREGYFKAQTLEFQFDAEVYIALKDAAFAPKPGDIVNFPNGSYTISHSQTYDPADDGAILTVAYVI